MSSKRQRGINSPPLTKLVLFGKEGVGKSGKHLFLFIYCWSSILN